MGNILDYKEKSLGEVFQEAASSEDENHMLMMSGMLRSVIYVACSKVLTDKVVNPAQTPGQQPKQQRERSIERIEILFNLLKQQPELSKILAKHIARLQLDRERILQGESVSKSWLFNEVFVYICIY